MGYRHFVDSRRIKADMSAAAAHRRSQNLDPQLIEVLTHFSDPNP